MQGRSKFTRQEAEEIKRILQEKATADRSRQKTLRGQLRSKYRFYITDFRDDVEAFAALDFEELVRRGVIEIEGLPARPPQIPGVDMSVVIDHVPATGPETPDAGLSPSDGLEASVTWYDQLRQEYRPDSIRYLLVAESPPDPGSGSRRFFYSPDLSQHDNLYRGVAQAVFGLEADFDVTRKVEVLRRLNAKGYWLIDAVRQPINKGTDSARRRAIRDEVPSLVEACQRLAPSVGIIICHGVVFDEVAPALREADLPLLHDQALPFPLGNWRARFIEGFRRALDDQPKGS
jgi:hypothetical protein